MKNCTVKITFHDSDCGNVSVLWGKKGKKGVAARFSWSFAKDCYYTDAISKVRRFIFLNNLYVYNMVITGPYTNFEAVYILDRYTAIKEIL